MRERERDWWIEREGSRWMNGMTETEIDGNIVNENKIREYALNTRA